MIAFNLKVCDQELKWLNPSTIISGSVGVLKVKIETCGHWKGLDITAQFVNGDHVLLVKDGETADLTSGIWNLCVVGRSETRRIYTESITVNVKKAPNEA